MQDTAQRQPDSGSSLVGIVLALWMVGGVFIDGWAHINLDSTTESFFTPWHAVLYSGFVALAAWMAIPLVRGRGQPLARRIPAGFGLGYAGIVVFAAGGVGDGMWHQDFGIEVGIAALLSPTHLLLLTGGVLLLTTPLRDAWRAGQSAPTLRSFMPALLSITLTAAVLAFFFSYAWGGLDLTPAAPVPAAAFEHGAPGHLEAEHAIVAGILGRLLTTVLLIGPLLLLLRRWQVPAGTATILFTTVSALMFALSHQAPIGLLVPPLVTGLVADLALARWVRGPAARAWIYGLAAGLTVVLWAGHFAALAITHGLAWPPELWGGAILLAALASAGMALLTFPPPVPVPEPAA